MAEEQQTSTFDLHIVFGGMCLLAREKDELGESSNGIHVLLPRMEPGQHAGHADHGSHEAFPPHRAVLMYAPQYSAARIQAPATVELEGKRVEFPDIGPRFVPESVQPFEGVVDLTHTLKGTVPRKLIDGSDLTGLLASVRVPAGEAASRSFAGWWRFDTETPMHMATWLEWAVPRIAGNELRIQVGALDRSGEPSTIVLRPDEGKIELIIFHAQPGDIPKRPRLPLPRPSSRPIKNHRVDHFSAFYCLLTGLTSKPVPRYEGPTSESSDTPKGTLGLDFRCINATALIEP